MRLSWIVWGTIAIACPSIAAGPSFEEARALAKAQPPKVAYDYEEKWDAVNNRDHLDERDGCYRKASGPIQQVLVIDASGKVTAVVLDVDNPKSQCFRKTYLGYQFPPPPFAPYYMYLRMK